MAVSRHDATLNISNSHTTSGDATPRLDYPLTAELVGADQPTGDPISPWTLPHRNELTLHMNLTWFGGSGERGCSRETRHDDTEARCCSADAYGAATPHPLNP
jgi:hypothetical protein